MSKEQHLLRGNPAWKAGFCPNPGGRPRKLIRRMEEALHAHGKDPIQEIMLILDDPDIRKTTKLKVWLELLPYIYPRAKDDPTPTDEVREALAAMTKEQLIERMETDLARLKNSG